jgi:hypothetical protein
MKWNGLQTAPKDGTKFLAWEENSEAQYVVIQWDSGIEQFVYAEPLLNEISGEEPRVTVWCSLPNPPA